MERSCSVVWMTHRERQLGEISSRVTSFKVDVDRASDRNGMLALLLATQRSNGSSGSTLAVSAWLGGCPYGHDARHAIRTPLNLPEQHAAKNQRTTYGHADRQ